MIVGPKLVVGNWKMHDVHDHASSLAQAIAEGVQNIPGNVRTVLCPPFTQLICVRDVLHAPRHNDAPLSGDTLFLGAQDCHSALSGAFTGDISARMLAHLDARYVILGHSERRHAHGETDAIIRQKVEAAEEAGLIPIVCVGEHLEDRRANQTASVLASQIDGSLTDDFNGVLAYEPVWAIGSGITPSHEELEQTLTLIRSLLTVRLKKDDNHVPVLYGGSVTAALAPSILSIDALDGVLVGSASLEAESFLGIVQAAADRSS